jgi:hypothetical protein
MLSGAHPFEISGIEEDEGEACRSPNRCALHSRDFFYLADALRFGIAG